MGDRTPVSNYPGECHIYLTTEDTDRCYITATFNSTKASLSKNRSHFRNNPFISMRNVFITRILSQAKTAK